MALAVSDPTRSLADPGALDRSTNSGALVSLEAAANRLCSRCSSALGRSSDYSTGSSAVDSCHSMCSAEPGRRPVGSKRSSAERELKWIRQAPSKSRSLSAQLPSSVAGRSLDPAILRTLCMLAQPDNGLSAYQMLGWISVVGFLITFLLASSAIK